MTIPPESFEGSSAFDSSQSEGDFPVPENAPPIPDDPSDGQPVEELTMAELVAQFFHSPGRTWNAFQRIVQEQGDTDLMARVPVVNRGASVLVPQGNAPAEAIALSPQERAFQQRELIRLVLRVMALAVAVYGNVILAEGRAEIIGLDIGAPFLVIGLLLWIAAEIFGVWMSQFDRFGRQAEWSGEAEISRSRAAMGGFGHAAEADSILWGTRFLYAGGAIVFSLLTVITTRDNRFRPEGVFTWVLSIVLWVATFAPAGWGLGALLLAVRGLRIRLNWTFWVMLVIMIVAAYFRLYNLNGTPPEMTSDHVEKLLDSQRILDGNPQVFFPNNGGREAIQFYLMALISQFPGLGMNFFTLKLLTAIEGLVTIPVLWWMGREVIGEEEVELGNIVGLVLAALVAVSYWHVMLSRLGLRIVLTTFFTALLVIYLSRALRRNQRGDFIKAGLTLGFGLYAYQAVRMLPLVVVLGVIFAIVFAWWRKREAHTTRRYVVNAGVLVMVSLAVFVPLLVFSVQYPDDFWRRTSGRLLGDDLIQTKNDKGELVERVATLDERMAAFQKNLPILLDNMRNALLMYNWKGDVAWVTAAPNRPEMDVYSGALLIVGVGAWLVRMVRRRDAMDWLILPMLVIMLLPSALSIAYPVENPSATRTSGTLPEAYLLAALPLALLILSTKRLLKGRSGVVVSFAVVGFVTLAAAGANWNTYFGEYNAAYLLSSPAPYSEAGKVLRGFADSGGSFGNAFMIAYPYWWDHRAVGIEAGLLDWPNGIVTLTDTPRFLYEATQRDNRYRLDPDKDLLFFYALHDLATDEQLKIWFPKGYSQLITSDKPGGDFLIYRVPYLGRQGFIDFAVRTGAAQ